MKDIKIYKTNDLVLKVDTNYNPLELKLDKWLNFIDQLCGDREYQKEAIQTAVIYLASANYSSVEDLIAQNWQENPELHSRYKTLEDYKSKLQLPHKLSGIVDLATGTGKSYVIYGVAQICLGLGLVDKVLVLCPSLTIEQGLKEKFEQLAGNNKLKASLPENAKWKNPRIVDANQTINDGDIAVENIHAVYERTGSSIEDSINNNGQKVLVLNDEAHHVYNSSGDKDIKKWKEFLLSDKYQFKYILGLTGTAYSDDDYFNDVIYRYSIRQAVEDHVVKSVEYVAKDENIDKNTKFQKIYDNHYEFKNRYRNIKPLTILVTKDITNARYLHEDMVDFLAVTEGIDKSDAHDKVLIVTSHNDHKKNLIKLKTVDDSSNPIEWVISVSMLTEGWDVKNVFQIVPMEDRAFNSKLLISQVLGRGLRIPPEYHSPQPKVRIFNHDAWSKNIRGLVDEVLEIEMRISSSALTDGLRSKYHFSVYNIDFDKTEKSVKSSRKTPVFDYSTSYISLVSQAESIQSETEYEDFSGIIKSKVTEIKKHVYTVDEVVDKILSTFNTRSFEAQIRFPQGTYSKENLPPKSEIKDIIVKSMKRVGIKSGLLTEDNALRTYQAFQTLFRKRATTIVFDRKIKKPFEISTSLMEKESIAVGMIRHGSTVFYSSALNAEYSGTQADILKEIIGDESLPRSASKEINQHIFKTPMDVVLTKQEPERKFIQLLTKPEVAEIIDAWVKSRDQNFYSIEYSWRKGEHPTQARFNPDFLIKVGENIAVIEIKADGDDSEENKAKMKWAKNHFKILNEELQKNGIKQQYFFHFLSPISYAEFQDYLSDGRLFKGEFCSALEYLLDSKTTKA